MSGTSKTILITGCTSGIGLTAAKILSSTNNPPNKLLLVARTLEKANAAKNEIISTNPAASSSSSSSSSALMTFGCDMSSLRSIRDFGAEIHQNDEIKNDGIDVICLNAGICTPRNSDVQFTEDGLELTLATNHFGPFLLTHSLLDMLNDNGRIVITASGVHDNSKKKKKKGSEEILSFNGFKGVSKTNLDGGGDDVVVPGDNIKTLDGSEFDYYQAYAMSKLCNVTFCLELNRRLEKLNRGLVANCFCPGLMTSTGLFRHQNSFAMGIFGFMANTVFGFGDTVEWGGGALAWMATSDEAGEKGGLYWKAPNGSSRSGGTYGQDFVPLDVSPEAADTQNQSELWKISANLVGVDAKTI